MPAMANPQGIHGICDRYLDELSELDPITATFLGQPGHDDELTDFSPDGHAARAELTGTARRAVAESEPGDEAERIAKAVFLERTGVEQELYEVGEFDSALNVIESPVQELRMVFDMMPTATAENWATIANRLSRVPDAVEGIKESLRGAASRGQVSALRQVTKVAEQCDTWSGAAGGSSYFADLATGAYEVDGVSDALRSQLDAAAGGAAAAYASLAGFLRDELAQRAPAKDAVGEDVYRLWSRFFTGAALDLQEAYEWGWQEFTRLETEMREVAARITGGGSMPDAAKALDADTRYQVQGRDAFQRWMQDLSDAAIADLRGTHFDIPDEISTLACRIAPQGGGVGAYYTNPSEDLTRPGTMWWSLPADRNDFSTWREVSTVYHEGVPGHHMQIATAVNEPSLNRYQRMLAMTSGHAEGWALYAERLMRELGYLTDDGFLLGMLDSHLFRAARVIVDIGMHLELPIPNGTGFHEGERWTPDLGLEFMLTRTLTDPPHVRDEIDRYLGWPGQAPSYKLGERLWLSAREDARRRAGASFDMKDFHTRALRMGSMGLDTFAECLKG